MFERYTEKARRVIFFARYEASQFGSPFIETEHLLLGLFREHKALAHCFLPPDTSVESIRREVEGDTIIRKKVSTSVDLPLSNESKRVLAYAAEEADHVSRRFIGSEHLFLGLLREKGCFAASILARHGVDLDRVRKQIAASEPLSLGEMRPTSDRGSGSGTAGVVAARKHLPVLEFICNGEIIASATPFVFTPVPRVGEQVTLRDKSGANVYYRVEDLIYWYEQFPHDIATAPHRLTKVVIRVKR